MKKLIFSMLLISALVACHETPEVAYVQPQQAVAQPVYAQHNNDGLLTGMLVGSMLSGGGRSNTTIVNNHTTVVAPPKTVTISKPVYATPNRPSYSSATGSFNRRR